MNCVWSSLWIGNSDAPPSKKQNTCGSLYPNLKLEDENRESTIVRDKLLLDERDLVSEMVVGHLAGNPGRFKDDLLIKNDMIYRTVIILLWLKLYIFWEDIGAFGHTCWFGVLKQKGTTVNTLDEEQIDLKEGLKKIF